MESVIPTSGCSHPWGGVIKNQNITINSGDGETTPLCWEENNDDIWRYYDSSAKYFQRKHQPQRVVALIREEESQKNFKYNNQQR